MVDYRAIVADAIGFVLRNLPAFLFVAALVVAAARRGYETSLSGFSRGYCCSRLELQSYGASITHIFFTATASAHIGWQVS